MKGQVQRSSEKPLVYNQDQTPLTNQGWLCPFQQTWELQKYDAVSYYF